MTPELPKGRKEYDDNPNHYFYDNKLFKRGSRGGNYEQTGTALTEARALIQLEEKILDKFGWESTKDIEKSPESRDVFARAIANEVNVTNLHPRTIKILDSVNRPFLVNTLSKLAQETDAEDRGDKAPFIEEEPVIHQDYDPEHPHEHNTFDLNFGDKVAEEDMPEWWNDPEQREEAEKANAERVKAMQKYESGEEEDNGQKEVEDFVNTAVDDIFKEMPEQPAEEEEKGGFWQDPTNYEVDVDEYLKTGEPVAKLPTDKRANEEDEYKGFEPEHELSDARKQMKGDIDTLKGFGDYKGDKYPEEGLGWQKGGENDEKEIHGTCPTCGFYSADEEELHSHVQDHLTEPAEEDFPYEDKEEETTVTAEPDLLQNVNTDVLRYK